MKENGPFWVIVYVLLVTVMVVAAIIQAQTAPTTLTPHLFGDKTSSMFDLWFIGHFMFGVILAGGWQRITREQSASRWWTQRWFLLLATSVVLWEVSELLMELGYFGSSIAHWKAGVEHWSNRYIADVGMAVVGSQIYRKWPAIFWPVVLLGVLWEVIHVLSPTAMTLQETVLSMFTY